MNHKTKASPASPSSGLELPPERLRWSVEPRALPAPPAQPARGVVGQDRALQALRFGLAMEDPGFNLFVAGPPGIGKMTAIRAFLDELSKTRPTPPDWCYVYNFEDPYRPRALRMPPGTAGQFARDLQQLLERLQSDIPKAFESADYRKKRDEALKAAHRERDRIIAEIGEKAEGSGFQVELSPMGVLMSPLKEGRPIEPKDFKALTPQQKADLQARREAAEEQVKQGFLSLRDVEHRARVELKELDRGAVLFVIGARLQELFERYSAVKGVTRHLEAVREDILQNIEAWKAAAREEAEEVESSLAKRGPDLRKYSVNVVVDHCEQAGAPVVVEWSPWLAELFGRCEKESRLGALYTDFTLIKPGALHRANGGYLVLPAEELLRSPFSWDALKRALRLSEIRIEDAEERFGWLLAKGLKPEPIALDVKIILVGRPQLYFLLHEYDEDFPELFRVKVEFDTRMPRGEKAIAELLAFLENLSRKEGVLAPDREAAARIVEHAARMAQSQTHLSAEFGRLAEIVREAGHYAKSEGAKEIGARHVRKALEERVYRSNLVESQIRDMIRDGTLLLELSGRRVGRVNGLSVLDLGDYAFGKPSRITASVGPGREGLVDIEREVELSGPIHSKGVLILNGYLVHRYAQKRPLTLSARLVFEQSYAGVEGDSASCAELYALLSALSGLPIRQGIAVTGSVNQHGEVQAIGGVNEKIEGFFDACRIHGLTGEQGVLIPASNLDNLMLREDVVAAVRKGRFHVWAVTNVDEGIEILTGAPAGKRNEKGDFAPGTVNALVEARLNEFGRSLRGEERRIAPKENRTPVSALKGRTGVFSSSRRAPRL